MSMANGRRFDLSNRLIHFFRALNLEAPDAPLTPETWGPGDIVEDVRISPFFLLRNSIRLGRLWASWSMRGRRPQRTIYGPDPAVCFTDMPLGAFLEAGEARSSRGQAMSPYGLVLPKAPLFRLGARPAIYGLSGPSARANGSGGGERLLPTDQLPLAEQYRYVAYAPGRVDWTHEREWRWPCRDCRPDDEDSTADDELDFELPPPHGMNIPGLHFDRPPVRGIGVVVKTRHQRDLVLHDILVSTDRACRRRSRYEFIVTREDLADLAMLRSPEDVERAIDVATFSLEPFYVRDRAKSDYLIGRFDRMVTIVAKDVPEPGGRDYGSCWLWLIDIRHPLTRALVAAERVVVNDEGRYLVRMDDHFDEQKTSLGQREEMTRRLADRLSREVGMRATYHSILHTQDPDCPGYYCEPPFDDECHFNYAHVSADF